MKKTFIIFLFTSTLSFCADTADADNNELEARRSELVRLITAELDLAQTSMGQLQREVDQRNTENDILREVNADLVKRRLEGLQVGKLEISTQTEDNSGYVLKNSTAEAAILLGAGAAVLGWIAYKVTTKILTHRKKQLLKEAELENIESEQQVSEESISQVFDENKRPDNCLQQVAASLGFVAWVGLLLI